MTKLSKNEFASKYFANCVDDDGTINPTAHILRMLETYHNLNSIEEMQKIIDDEYEVYCERFNLGLSNRQ